MIKKINFLFFAPVQTTYSDTKKQQISGNAKLNMSLQLPNDYDVQISTVYLAPDIIPQGKIDRRYAVDFGVKKRIQRGKGELFLNATDLFNTMQLKKEITGTRFRLQSTDFYETQVIRLGYSYKF